MPNSYEAYFQHVTGVEPWPWQARLGTDAECGDRLLRIPTGFGKTAGTVLPWLFHRVKRGSGDWPTRLVFCLPMRTLVEQTQRNIVGWLERSGLTTSVGVHVLMGGVEAAPWVMEADRPTILVGTQDMLLSRALMRGYGSARGKWPMEFGLLNHDALWVIDELQLMGVGLATSTQLAAFRAQHAPQTVGMKPARTWWMSATLQPWWLESVDFASNVNGLEKRRVAIPKSERKGGLFKVERALERMPKVAAAEEVAAMVRELHQPGGLSLVITNTVERAIGVVDALRPRAKKGKGAPAAQPEVVLIHSRFRGVEREAWARTVLQREAPLPAEGRIIVSTQVVEAGVDVSASLLVTDLAPWSSLVQRFGRCARYAGDSGRVVVVGPVPKKADEARPYEPEALAAASKALSNLGDDAGPGALEAFEESLDDDTRRSLFPFEPRHVLRRKDLDDLFDTTPDLNGADLDVGRFIRDGEDRDCAVFWRPQLETEAQKQQPFPARRELCPVPAFGKRGLEQWLKDGRAAWMWDYLDSAWRPLRRVVPGATVMLDAGDGGYSANGWDPSSRAAVEVVQPEVDAVEQRIERSAAGQEEDSLSIAGQWQSVAEHGADVGSEATRQARALGLVEPLVQLLGLAGRWHDAGKAHRAFQSRLAVPPELSSRGPFAKAPPSAWRRGDVRGFRHELASTLLLFEALAGADARHVALAEGVRELLSLVGHSVEPPSPLPASPLLDELRALDADAFDLVAYLVCAHHGKVRCQWSPSEHDAPGRVLGVAEGDGVEAFELSHASGRSTLPPLRLHLDAAGVGLSARYGRSWSERVDGLLQRFGPFQLAFLEALLRAGDWKASSSLQEVN